MRFAAVDLGASSGRVVVADVAADRLDLRIVHRFPNGPVRRPEGLVWDASRLRREVLAGLSLASSQGPLTSVGIDSWAVDHALLAGGRVMGDPFCHRDERRCEVGPARVHSMVAPDELYRRNGLQHLPFTTLYQLAADDRVGTADRMLLVPDLVAWWLTGREVAERTNASTTGLLSVSDGEWDRELVGRLGLPQEVLPPLVDPGEVIGTIGGGAASLTGLEGVPVVAVGSHDTASAVVGTPLSGPGSAYISLGTWGLVGLELEHPVLSDAARVANVTNEGGVDGRVRFLTNVMGTWLVSETLRAWGLDDSALPGLLDAAARVPPADLPDLDVQDPRFLAPGDLPARARDWALQRGFAPPDDRAAYVRWLVDSLAGAYATALTTVARLAGRELEVVHVVGGGSRNELLCQAIADRARLPVVAGPVEATAIGNVLIQARAAGVLGPRLDELRDLVRATQELRTHHPRAAGAASA